METGQYFKPPASPEFSGQRASKRLVIRSQSVWRNVRLSHNRGWYTVLLGFTERDVC